MVVGLVRFYLCNFWATVCKTVRPVLPDLCLSVLSVMLVLSNGSMDQDKTLDFNEARDDVVALVSAGPYTQVICTASAITSALNFLQAECCS